MPLTKPQILDAIKVSGIKFDPGKLIPVPVHFSLDAEHPFNSPNTASLNGIAWFCCSHVENDIEVLNPGQGFLNVWFQGVNPSKNYLVT
ncbi:MAG TPA: hypothetical protein VKT78_18755, partial [Fimbriimonadaceae bacterium]|nr:hypothetical protein [Fimbriimonadaceae bacterium]